MKVTLGWTEWHVDNEEELEVILRKRDCKGGAEFWMGDGPDKYPCMAIIITNEVCHVIYFPEEEHAGFRLLGGEGLPLDGYTRFIWDGADPGYGEDHPNKFVVPLSKGLTVAKEFLRQQSLPASGEWCEL